MNPVSTGASDLPLAEPLILDRTAAQTAAADQAEAAAAERADAAPAALRREQRQMTAAWVSLILGITISIGTFGFIATHDYNADRALAPASSVTAP